MNTTYPNDILPFGVSGRVENGDVLTLEQYQTDPQRLVGHQPGIARQALENTALRQVSHMAAGLAQYIANRYPGGVRDDGDLDAVECGLLAAVASGLAWSKETDYAVPSLVAHGARVYVAVAPSGPHASVGPQQPTASASPYWKAVTPDTDGVTIEAVDDALTVLAAPKLKTPRNIVLYGGATGAATFDGAADARIDVTSLDLGKGTGILPVSKGGTGAATVDGARANLDIVLNNTVTSTSTKEFATANSVKTAYDKAVSADSAAGSRVVALEAYRQSRIGTPHHLSSTTLPAGYMWADGSLALFADWPELADAYNAGRFNDMLLAWNASSASKSSYPAMWVPNAANPSGLYLPRLGGLFSRNWVPGSGNAGARGEDTGRGLTGGFNTYTRATVIADGVITGNVLGWAEVQWVSGMQHGNYTNYRLDASRVWGSSHTGAEFAPVHTWQPTAIYLGCHA